MGPALALLLLLACEGGVAPIDGATPDAGVDVARVLPDELADEEALARMLDWGSLPVPSMERPRRASSVERPGTEPIEGFAIIAHGNRDMNNFVCASADAIARGPEVIPRRLDLPACPEDWVRGFVMARFEGSGRLSRVWLTALSARAAPVDEEVLRVYVDDERAPAVQVPLAAAMDGSAGEVFAPPFGAGSERHLAWYYPVVFGTRLVVSIDRLGPVDAYYHQVDVALDPAPRRRAAAGARLGARDEAIATLRGERRLRGEPREVEVVVPAGATVTALALDGPATVVALRARGSTGPGAVSVLVTWDDAATPAIDAPLEELFAAALDAPEQASLALSAGELRLPMPFESAARIELRSHGAEVTIELGVETVGGPVGPLRLHAGRSESVPPATRHPVVSADGRGRLAGVCLMMEGGPIDGEGAAVGPFNFLEGDERLVVDGDASDGTGTEDYLDGAFYFAGGAFATPFAQVWGVTEESPVAGRVTGCRWHVLGAAVDYERSLSLDLEIGPGRPEVLRRYRSIAFVYR